ncbi:enoyl-CoA hydratase [Zhengella mangrovi]|uniref:Enoyl-CoA hydratase n=1 Tax=Zhengella mangrovi TaxID=1982044 RepID=A0A2G1QR82_9HYPH|nr:crotonase/enoyl-CoA hydratase family protein [Zhengella mangrovi]PHP67964.1 enoyl-CoA hydratase [Zhengella mangrovi]
MSESVGTFFTVRRDGPVAEIAMNRPDVANAMSPDFWEDLPRIMDDLAADGSVRAAILTGEGRHFSGGMDLATFNSIAALLQSEPGRAAHALRGLILKLQDSFTAIERAPFPVIAAIHGACIGGAIDMITACDIRLASADAFFAIEEINIGMAADVGTLQRLPKLIAPALAAELALTGRRFDAAEARAMGLVSQVAADRDSVVSVARDMAQAMAARSPLAMAGIKRNLAYARDHSVADGLDYIATWNGGMLRAEDLMEAIKARGEKRQALFKDLGKPA